MEVWERVRRYLILWLIIAVALVVIALVIYKDVLWEWIQSSITDAISGIAVIAIMLYGLGMIIRSAFPPRY